MLGDTAWKSRSSQYNTIAQARASLSEPSRPYTPAEPSRHLFRAPAASSASAASAFGASALQRPDTSNNIDMRPNSSFRVGASSFAAASMPRVPAPRPVISASGAEVFTLDTPSSAGAPAMAATQPTHSRIDPKENIEPPAHQPPPPPQSDWWEKTSALLGQLDPTAPVEALIKSCDQLWERLRGPGGPAGPAGADALDDAELARRRKEVIAAVARLMERRESPLLLRLCRFFLRGATAERSAQLGACKLLFKLSKSESNDARFRELGLLPLLLTVLHPEHTTPADASAASRPGTSAGPANAPVALEPVGGCEALLYAAGALKLTSKDGANQKALLSLGAVAAFAAALRAQTARLLAPSTPRGEGRGVKPAHVLVQLTEGLRNVAISGSSRKQFVGSGCVEALCVLFDAAPTNGELCLNVSRVLAKLSLHEDVRARIDAQPAYVDAMAVALTHHHAEPQVLIRLCFILGNLSATNERNRESITRIALPLLLQLLEQYAAQAGGAAAPAAVSMGVQTGGGEGMAVAISDDAEATGDGPTDASSSSHDAASGGAAADARGATRESDAERSVGESSSAKTDGSGGSGGGAPPESIDVLVKLIRLLAHLAISPHIGEQIATYPQSLALLRVLTSFSMERHEELQLNAISCVTNLSYYLVDGSVLLESHEALCTALIPVLVFPNTEGMIEAARALGNLSRLEGARATICKVRVHEALLLLLDHTSSQVAEGACGALINLAADAHTREKLLEAGAAPHLADLLLSLLTPMARPTDGGGAPAAPSSTLRSDIGAALLATKTLCNLCCLCTVSPLPADLAVALEQQLSEGKGTPPAEWQSAGADVADMLAEWPQATSLLLSLLSRLPASDLPSYGADDGEYEYEEDDLEELPVLG